MKEYKFQLQWLNTLILVFQRSVIRKMPVLKFKKIFFDSLRRNVEFFLLKPDSQILF